VCVCAYNPVRRTTRPSPARSTAPAPGESKSRSGRPEAEFIRIPNPSLSSIISIVFSISSTPPLSIYPSIYLSIYIERYRYRYRYIDIDFSSTSHRGRYRAPDGTGVYTYRWIGGPAAGSMPRPTLWRGVDLCRSRGLQAYIFITSFIYTSSDSFSPMPHRYLIGTSSAASDHHQSPRHNHHRSAAPGGSGGPAPAPAVRARQRACRRCRRAGAGGTTYTSRAPPTWSRLTYLIVLYCIILYHIMLCCAL
jgi:hypothetical protein